jgi:RNA polymerase-binding transcription factor DksA
MDSGKQQKYKPVVERQIREVRRILENSSKVAAGGDYLGQLSQLETMQGQELALDIHRRRTSQIARLERALSLIEDGKYGNCLNCGEEISEKRLGIYPDEVFCSACRV